MNPRKVIERIVVGTVQPITDALIRAHVHPNLLTTVGFLVTVSSGAAFYTNHIRTAGALILIGGIFDVFDGKVARATGLTSQFGSFYDSTLDRFSEIAVYVGILTLYNHYDPVTGDLVAIYAVILAMAGSLMVSYTRAKAEALGIDLSSPRSQSESLARSSQCALSTSVAPRRACPIRTPSTRSIPGPCGIRVCRLSRRI